MVHFAGSPLAGANSVAGPATQPAAPAGAGDAWSVHATLIAVERLQPAGEPLGATARLVMADSAGAPVRPSSRLARDARVIGPPDAANYLAAASEGAATSPSGRAASLLDARGALPPGVTAAFAVDDAGAPPAGAAAAARRIEVQVYRQAAGSPNAATTVQVGLVVHDLAPSLDEEEQPESPAKATTPDAKGKAAAPAPAAAAAPLSPPKRLVSSRELALIDRELVSGATSVALLVPFQFANAGPTAVVALIEVGPPSADPDHAAAVARCLEDLREAGATIRSAGGIGADGAVSRAQAAFAALARPDRSRAALAFLAGDTGASLCEDAALAADAASLARLAADVQKKAGGSIGVASASASRPATAPAAPPDLGWLLDRTAFELMAELLAADKLPAEWEAVLATHAGEAGRNAASAETVARGLASRADFDNRLLAENLIFLEDGSPSARVRAFDWLRARGRGPAGYDPLGAPRERRDALERAANPPAGPSPATLPVNPQPSAGGVQ